MISEIKSDVIVVHDVPIKQGYIILDRKWCGKGMNISLLEKKLSNGEIREG